MRTVSALLLAGVLSAGNLAAGAQTPDQTNPPTTTTANGRETPAQTRIVNSFAAFAGSEANAQSLVTGLRQGSEITLTAPGTGGQTGTSTTFTPPTRPMGYGNVRIALALAQEQLAQTGITQPTPEQLRVALMGGTTTEFAGVLQMRADGMGWGQIANSMGVKLGHVLSGRTGQQPSTASSPASSGSASTGADTGTGTGITTATGGTSAAVTTRNRGNSASAQQTRRPGAGIVTAAGVVAAGASAGPSVQSGGNAAGVVTGAGVAAGSRASATGQAHGKGFVEP